MPDLRVIEGGLPSGEPPAIVWNRLPLDDQRRALVIRDSGPGLAALAWDDGRAFLVGIRELRLPGQEAALEAWKTLAEVAHLPIRDERAPRPLAEGSISTAQAIELERRRRAVRREVRQDPGYLFDFTSRDRRDLFT